MNAKPPASAQYITWKRAPDPNAPGKLAKHPADHRDGRAPVNAHNPAIWTTLDNAKWRAAALGPDYGAGFVLTDADQYGFIDLDHCVVKDAAGNPAWSPFAHEVLGIFPGAYVDISPSGEGLHILFSYRGTAPKHGNKPRPGLEFYTGGRFATMTGNGAVGDAATDHTSAMLAFITDYAPPTKDDNVAQWTEAPVWSAAPFTDLKAAITAHKERNPLFKQLMDGDTDALMKRGDKWAKESGDFDGSHADLITACEMLRLRGGDCQAVLGDMQSGELTLYGKRKAETRWLKKTILAAFEKVSKNPPTDTTTLGFGSGPAPAGLSATPVAVSLVTMAPGTDWSEPINFFGDTLEAQPFTGDEFPEVVSAYPLLYSQQTGIDAGIMLNAAVTVMAGAIPDQIKVCADAGSEWFVEPRMWHLVIGTAGTGKSPGHGAMLKPLRELNRQLHDAWRAACAASEDEKHYPPMPRVIIQDATIEGLAGVLEQNPRGILIANDEFTSWIGGFDAYKSGAGGKDRAEWMRLFDGGPSHIERASKPPRYIENWGASVLSATTPTSMEGLAKHLGEDGLIQRFCVYIARSQAAVVTSPPSLIDLTRERERYKDTVRRLWDLPQFDTLHVNLAADAKARFAEWRVWNKKTQEALEGTDTALASYVAKNPTMLLRVALVFHCAQCVHMKVPHPANHALTLRTLELAIAFMRLSFQHARVMYGRRGSPVVDLARDVARYVLANSSQDVIQRRELVANVRAYRAADDSSQARALRLVEDYGWLRAERGPYHKDQPTRFAVNPGIAAKFAELAAKERERREHVRELIKESVQQRREVKC